MSTRRQFLGQSAASLVAIGMSQHVNAQSAQSKPVHDLQSRRIPNTDLTVSRIAYGTALWRSIDWSSAEFAPTLKKAIRLAYENGITLFDLADTYGLGKSETTLGELLKESPGLRDRIVIQTKCGMILKEGWTLRDPIGIDLSRDHIIHSAEQSLRRLGTDRLDILQLHMPDTLVHPEEVADAFDFLNRAGKVRYFGLSNYSPLQIEVLRKYVRQPLVVNQIWFGLGNLAPLSGTFAQATAGVVDYCRVREMQVQAHSSLRGGFLKLTPDASAPLRKVAELLVNLAKEKDTNPSAIALAWLLHHPAGIVPVIGSHKPEYIMENCAADRVVLSDEEWYVLFRAATDMQQNKAS